MSSAWKWIRIGALLWILAILLYIFYTPQLSAPAQTMAPPEAESKSNELLAWWKEQEQMAELAGFPDEAASYKARTEAYQQSLDAGEVLLPTLADLPASAMKASIHVKLPRAPLSGAPLAKHEPASGVYLGMLGADRRVGYDVKKIESVYGRKHALYLAYVGWHKVQTTNTYFPKSNADRIKELGGALQIGWEPRFGLDDVKDDEYVRRFAREAKESGIPIFLRYASEMNGAWVPWHGEPQKYIEKFRLVHDIMAEEAPNVAMVWSPNFWPPDTIDDYYPGDEYVDWVGFSLYATPMANGKEQLQGSIIDLFEPLYDRYKHKPIMISEGAVAHSVISTKKSYPEWAELQLGYFYGVLPKLYSQIKAITYFNFSRAQAGRSNMDFVYDLGELPFTDGLYRRLARSEQFLSDVERGADPLPYRYHKITSRSLGGKQTLLLYAKLEDGSRPFALGLFMDGKRVGLTFEPPWEVEVNIQPDTVNGAWQVVAYNQQMQPIAVTSVLP